MYTLQYWLFCRPPNNISAMGWFRLSIVLARVLPIPHGAPALLCLGKHLSEPGIRCEPRLNDGLQSSDNVGHDWLYKSFLRTISYNLPWKCTWISLCRIGDFERIYDRQNIEQRKPWFFSRAFHIGCIPPLIPQLIESQNHFTLTKFAICHVNVYMQMVGGGTHFFSQPIFRNILPNKYAK